MILRVNNLKSQPQWIIHGFVLKNISVAFFEAIACSLLVLHKDISRNGKIFPVRLAAMNNYTTKYHMPLLCAAKR